MGSEITNTAIKVHVLNDTKGHTTLLQPWAMGSEITNTTVKVHVLKDTKGHTTPHGL